MIIQGVADALANQGRATEDDLALAREATAFYLKLSESILREAPGNLKLAYAVAGGFTQYAFAFVAFEAERLGGRPAGRCERDEHQVEAWDTRVDALLLPLYGMALRRHAVTGVDRNIVRGAGFLFNV